MRKGISNMEIKKTPNLLFDGLKHDEIELLEWYHHNPLSVYIEISLMVMLNVGIITKEQYKTYKAQAEENADLLRGYLRRGENGSLWEKEH
jgi:hypothetical protein